MLWESTCKQPSNHANNHGLALYTFSCWSVPLVVLDVVPSSWASSASRWPRPAKPPDSLPLSSSHFCIPFHLPSSSPADEHGSMQPDHNKLDKRTLCMGWDVINNVVDTRGSPRGALIAFAVFALVVAGRFGCFCTLVTMQQI
ncbi:expressed unknown protein [Seminavis robusta]|uniref:Uncharacterized protein n=1 Tax=Seminavis robusta TaxID=568900 RepID=A0A9N8HDZ6_9STRA|nr:expressed unknown protein [Seminavis robusta]|eukprot:Sro449_g145311.1  (143) ;mRNA; r:31820-32248